MRRELSRERLIELLIYDPDTGHFTRRIARGNSPAGAVAGNVHPRGYVLIAIDGRDYRAHRLAWLYMTGEMPCGDVDHRDGNPGNNRWANLRDVSHRVNGENQRRPHRNNKSGFLGVHRHKNGGFVASIRVAGKFHYLGCFDTPQDASHAYVKAKRRLHVGCTL